MNYVAAAYTVAALLFGGYTVWLGVRLREAEKKLDALSKR